MEISDVPKMVIDGDIIILGPYSKDQYRSRSQPRTIERLPSNPRLITGHTSGKVIPCEKAFFLM
jgi:hypothetical protein